MCLFQGQTNKGKIYCSKFFNSIKLQEQKNFENFKKSWEKMSVRVNLRTSNIMPTPIKVGSNRRTLNK